MRKGSRTSEEGKGRREEEEGEWRFGEGRVTRTRTLISAGKARQGWRVAGD